MSIYQSVYRLINETSKCAEQEEEQDANSDSKPRPNGYNTPEYITVIYSAWVNMKDLM